MKAIVIIGIILGSFSFNYIVAQDHIFMSSSSGEMLNQSKDLKKQFRYGVKLGLNLSTIPTSLNINTSFNENKNIDLDTQYLLAYYLGFFTEYAFDDNKLKAQAEILYARNGSKHSTNNYIKIDELLLPIILKYDIIDNYNVNMNIYGGLFAGYIFKVFGYKDYKNAPKYDITNQYKSFDYGLILGLDYEITDNIIIDARFNYGLLNISKSTTTFDQIESELTSHNRFFHIGIGYLF